MKYEINGGNSTSGPIGFVLRLEAESAEAALKEAQELLTE